MVTYVTALLALFGSDATPETTAVLVNVPAEVARTTMVTRATLDSDSAGHWHVMTVVPAQPPRLPACVAEMSVMPAGRLSVSVAAALVAGPWFSTSRV